MSYFRSISFRLTFWVSTVVVTLVSIHIYQINPERRFLELKMAESERIARIIESSAAERKNLIALEELDNKLLALRNRIRLGETLEEV